MKLNLASVLGKTFGLLLPTVCLLALAGCSTSKNTFLNRNYHNLTAYYNIYWNGLQSRIDADEILKDRSADNYFNVIPVFKYGSTEDTAMISAQTARMIEKAVKVVKKHSISIRGKEYVKTVDNAYLLMGQGFFYQKEYSKARTVFNFVLSEFAANPEHYEAMLWIARTYILEEDFSMAYSFLSQVDAQNENNLMKQTYRDLPLVQAEYLLKQEKYTEAVPYLQTGIERCRNRDLKARLYFILGQIAQRNEDNTQAYEYYRTCLKLNPPLDLVFNARLNMALCSDVVAGNRDILKGLRRMLKDPKNSAYFGRIYYVMGEITFRYGNDEEAVKYMEQSIAASQNDPERTLMAARRLSSYFYDNKQYIKSQKYYEIAAKVVDYDDPEYYIIVSRAENLAGLTRYYGQMVEADTLRQVGLMGRKDQYKYAETKARQYVQQQEAARKAKKDDGGPSLVQSNWYFYNEQTKNAGLSEFMKKWGRRELEDLWFLSSKPAMAALRPMGGNMDETGFEEEEAAPKILTPADPEYYLAQLPVSDDDYRKLDSIIEPAFYHIGVIYCDRLGENSEGEPYLVRLVREYPASPYVPSACELLCKVYRQGGDMTSFRKYADVLAQRFAGSEQDQRVNNPNYYRDLEANAKKVEKLYGEAYGKFMNNDFRGVLDIVSRVEKEYPVNNFREQFLYLKIISTAHVYTYEKMLPLTRSFVTSYPESALVERVRAAEKKAREDMSKRIYSAESDPVIEPVQPAETEKEQKPADSAASQPKEKGYEKGEKNEPHSVLVICEQQEREPTVMVLRVKGFNDKYYSDGNLRETIVASATNKNRYAVVISSFSDMREASKYKKMILDNDYVFGNIEKKNVIEINDRNINTLKETRGVALYEQFYQKEVMQK